jgi:hypothetical protein
MAKSLDNILKGVNKSKIVPGSTGDDPGVDYAGKMKDERDFVALHKTEKYEDRVGNGEDVYNASKVKKAKMERHGHDPDPKAKSVYKQANEAKDPREYGYEGEMAISQIKSIMNHSEQLMKMLKPETDLPEWVQSKITLANDYIQTAADYYATEVSEASKCNMTEAGAMCEVHGMKSCDSKEEKDSASDKEPRYNGKKKEGRQLITDKKKIEEREMTSAEKKKEEKLKDKFDPSSMKSDMKKQYGKEKGEQVYFAYIRKKSMNKEQADTNVSTPSTAVGDTGRV